jgi:hypothetical protein
MANNIITNIGNAGTDFIVSTGGLNLAGALNGLTLAYQSTGFTIAGGTTSKTLTVDSNFSTSSAMSNPMTTLGDTIYGAVSGVATRLAGNITTTKQFLSQTGDGANSASPTWSTITSSNVVMPTLIGTPTYTTQNDFNNSFGSTGRKTGGVASDATGSKVAVTGGTGFIKATDDDNAQLIPFNWSAPADISIPADSSRYIGVEYNSGTPQIVTKTSSTWDYDTEFPLARVVNDTVNSAEELYVVNTPWWVTDGMTNIIQALRSFGLVRRDDYVGGLMLSATGTRNVAVSAGTVWAALNDTAFAGLDTSVTGTFEYYWKSSTGGWQKSDATQYSVLQYNDVSQATLQNLSANKYANVWVYGEMSDSTITIALLYPQAQYNTAAEAEAKSAPDNVPPHISQLGMLLGRYIIKQGVDAPISTQSVFTTKFGTSVVTSHANLGSLGWTSSGHTGTASTIAGFAASTGVASEYTLSGTGTVLALASSPVFVTPTLGAATGTTGLFGATANLTDWPTARIVGSQADSGHSYSGNIGVVGESVASASDTGTGVGGVSVTNGANEARGVTGVGKIGATGDTAKAQGIYGYVNGTHAGGDNIGVRGSAINGANNYSFYGEAGKIYSSGDIELGHLTDTTFARVSAGLVSIEGNNIITANQQATALAATSSGDKDKYLHSNASTGAMEWSTVSGSGATTALDNLASVAINTTLVSDTDNTDALGTTAIAWSDLFLGNESVISWNSAPSTPDVTLTHSANTLTLGGATTLALGTTNITMTGSLGETGSRLTKGWFTDLEVTNAIAGSITGNAATVTSFTPASGSLTLSGADALTLTTTAATDVTLPTTGTLSTLAGTEELDNKTLDTSVAKGTWTTSGTWTLPSLTLGGVNTLSENASIALDPAGSADEKWSGTTVTGTAGATLAVGDLIYLDVTATEWLLTDADASATAGPVVVGICILAANDGQATNILLNGTVRSAAFPASIALGAPVYIGTDAGDITATQPSGADDVIRVMGWTVTAEPNTIYFNPSSDYITHI